MNYNVTDNFKSFQCMATPNCTGQFIANWTSEHCLPQSVKDIRNVSMSVIGKNYFCIQRRQTFNNCDGRNCVSHWSCCQCNCFILISLCQHLSKKDQKNIWSRWLLLHENIKISPYLSFGTQICDLLGNESFMSQFQSHNSLLVCDNNSVYQDL